MNYGVDDDEVFGEIDIDKLLDMSEETCYYSASQQSAIEQELLFYLIAKEMWNYIKQSNSTECTMCTHPERSVADANHSCTYLQALYFVTPPYRLHQIIDTYYEEATDSINWMKIRQGCCKLTMSHTTVNQCNKVYWKTRSRNETFDRLIKANLYELARQGCYFRVVLQIMGILGLDTQRLFKHHIIQ